VVFLDPRANAELVPRLHVALHASLAALPMVTSKFRPNIALPTLAPILLNDGSVRESVKGGLEPEAEE
jgi:hypothetical protein